MRRAMLYALSESKRALQSMRVVSLTPRHQTLALDENKGIDYTVHN